MSRFAERISGMRKIAILSFALLCIAPIIAPADSLRRENSKIKVSDKVRLKAYPFDLKDVRLLDGPFRDASRRDQQYLLDLDVDRLLHNFRVTAGLPSAAKPYGGW